MLLAITYVVIANRQAMIAAVVLGGVMLASGVARVAEVAAAPGGGVVRAGGGPVWPGYRHVREEEAVAVLGRGLDVRA